MIKVLETIVPDEFPFSDPDDSGIRELLAGTWMRMVSEVDGVEGKFLFVCEKGLKYNGFSDPIEWPVRSYYGNPKKDAAGLAHDILYANGGEVVGLGRNLNAGECDDVLRGAMREAGFSRVDSGIVDWCVRHFAHLFHFGKKRDKEGMHLKSRVVWIPKDVNEASKV